MHGTAVHLIASRLGARWDFGWMPGMSWMPPGALTPEGGADHGIGGPSWRGGPGPEASGEGIRKWPGRSTPGWLGERLIRSSLAFSRPGLVYWGSDGMTPL